MSNRDQRGTRRIITDAFGRNVAGVVPEILVMVDEPDANRHRRPRSSRRRPRAHS